MQSNEDRKAYLVGGGIGSLSAAVLLIRDGGFRGSNVRIIEELPLAGGALDGSGDPVKGFVSRGGRMLTEETYVCLWNVLDSIPSLDDASKSVKQQTWVFNDEWRSNSKARLIDRDRRPSTIVSVTSECIREAIGASTLHPSGTPGDNLASG